MPPTTSQRGGARGARAALDVLLTDATAAGGTRGFIQPRAVAVSRSSDECGRPLRRHQALATDDDQRASGDELQQRVLPPECDRQRGR